MSKAKDKETETRLAQAALQDPLNDLGAGFSSLSYMRNSPVDVVKIDGAFLKNIESNLVDFALLQSINEIAHLLGKRTVARARQFREHPPTFGRNRDRLRTRISSR